jgi:hypothetical protein
MPLNMVTTGCVQVFVSSVAVKRVVLLCFYISSPTRPVRSLTHLRLCPSAISRLRLVSRPFHFRLTQVSYLAHFRHEPLHYSLSMSQPVDYLFKHLPYATLCVRLFYLFKHLPYATLCVRLFTAH